MPIPQVDGELTVENMFYTIPTKPGTPQSLEPRYILIWVSFCLQPEKVLAIIGASAAGKSTLAKIIVSVWNASTGSVTLDRGDVYTWNWQSFGQHVDYLPQGVELFGGTIK
jgi:ABC-type protease/lipase transport system fused ATPase/permease subunit